MRFSSYWPPPGLLIITICATGAFFVMHNINNITVRWQLFSPMKHHHYPQYQVSKAIAIIFITMIFTVWCQATVSVSAFHQMVKSIFPLQNVQFNVVVFSQRVTITKSVSLAAQIRTRVRWTTESLDCQPWKCRKHPKATFLLPPKPSFEVPGLPDNITGLSSNLVLGGNLLVNDAKLLFCSVFALPQSSHRSLRSFPFLHEIMISII